MKSIDELFKEYTVECERVDTPELRDKYRCISKETLALLLDIAAEEAYLAGKLSSSEKLLASLDLGNETAMDTHI